LIVDKGKQTHATISKEGFIEKDAFLGSALVDMYAKCGDLQTARKVFDQVAARNVICWNTLIAGYVQEGKGKEALECCDRMKREGFSPDTVTFLHMLKACGIMGAVDKAEQIHDELVRNGLVTAKDAALGAALVDAYVKCGESGKAQEVFDALPIRDAVTWNALISGYTQRGQGEGALSCFRRMQRDNISPDAVTFLCILTACSRCGLVQEGLTHFKSMSSRYGLQALIEHYTCVIDLLGRAGHLEEAMTLMKEMVPSSDYAAWSSLLAACEKWGNVKLGRLAFEHAVQLDNANSRSYVYMSSIYAKAGLLEEKEEIEKLHVRRSNQID
jgi:pentatricopeptide repeat protein